MHYSSSQDTSSATSYGTPDAFSSKQSLFRSISRAEKNLPNSPRKKSAVIGNLAKKYNLRIELKENRGRKTKTLTQEQKEWLIDYLERPEMTYANPGRKDNVYIGKIDGKKQYLEKHYLLWTLRDASGILNNQEDGFNINFEDDLSFTVIYRFIKHKKQFIYQRDIPCLCEICGNAGLMAKAVRKRKSGHPTSAHDIVEKYSCDSNDSKCMLNTCDHCQPTEILKTWDTDESSSSSSSSSDSSESSDDEAKNVTFTKWIREDKKIKKVTTCLEEKEFYNEWKGTVITLKPHIHRKRVQAAAYKSIKANLQQGEAVVHIDYSESYKNKQQEGIQSAYFGQSSFSLSTACAYHVDDKGELVKRPITVVSESSDHSRLAALTCIDFVVREVEKHITLKKLILWSDGCAAQFRSRFVFKLISTYLPDLVIDWHYNEAHHGKGPIDGVGGTVKNVVYRKVKGHHVIVNSAQEFYQAANQFCPAITTLFQDTNALLKEPSDIEDAPVIPATLKIHKLSRRISTNEASVDFFFLLNSKEPCHTEKYVSRKKCGHVDRDFNSLALFRSTGAHCLGKHLDKSETQDWLRCPMCLQWFHENCFEQ